MGNTKIEIRPFMSEKRRCNETFDHVDFKLHVITCLLDTQMEPLNNGHRV